MSFKNSRKIKYINQEKLGYDFLDKCINYKNVIIQADTGTGKTSTVKNYLKKNNLKFISITSRKSLALEHKRIFEEYGIDCQVYTDNLTFDKSTIIQLESLEKLFKIIRLKDLKNYVLFIDECSSFIQHYLQSPTVIQGWNSRMDIMADLQNIMENCKKVICVDANITENVFNFIGFNQEKILYIENSYKNNKNTEAEEIDKYQTMVDKLKNLDAYMVACDSKKNAIALYEALTQKNDDDEENDEEILLLTADMKKSTQNINIYLDSFKKIIFSPKVIYGLDSVMIRPMFAYYKCNIIDAYMFYQQISRCRNIEKLWFYFSEKPIRKRLYQSIDDVHKQHKEIDDYIEKRYERLGKSLIFKLLENLKVYQKFKTDEMSENPYEYFCDILISRGFKLKTLRNKKNKNKLSKSEKNELVKQHNEKNFDFKDNLPNDFLKLPKEMCEENIELLSNSYDIEKHKNLFEFLDNDFNTLDFISEERARKKTTDEIIIDKYYKIRKLKLWMNLIGCDGYEKISIYNKDISKKEMENIFKGFQLMYPRTQKKLKDIYDIIVIIKQLINDILPKNTYKCRRVNLNKNKTKKVYELTLSSEIVNYHRTIKSYRETKNDSNFIDEDDSYSDLDD